MIGKQARVRIFPSPMLDRHGKKENSINLGSDIVISLKVKPCEKEQTILVCFKNSFLSPPPADNARKFFSDIYCENLVQLLEVKSTKAWGPLDTLRVFNSQTWPDWASGNVSVSCSGAKSHGDFYSCVSTLDICGALCLPVCLNHFGGISLSCNL